jgi:hypothetical protein
MVTLPLQKVTIPMGETLPGRENAVNTLPTDLLLGLPRLAGDRITVTHGNATCHADELADLGNVTLTLSHISAEPYDRLATTLKDSDLNRVTHDP